MKTCEECYEYVIRRRDELAARKLKIRENVRTATLAAGGSLACAGVIFVAARQQNLSEQNITQSTISPQTQSTAESVPNLPETSANYTQSSTILPQEQSSVESLPKHQNTVNIGTVNIPKPWEGSFFPYGRFCERTREDTLSHFGLSADFSLPNFSEVPPECGIPGERGKYGYRVSLDFDGDESELQTSWQVDERFDSQVFSFENDDGTKGVNVTFSRSEFIPWWLKGNLNADEVKQLPQSEIANTKMRIAKEILGEGWDENMRARDFYYAEFSAGELAVGVSARGLSEEELIAVLEYLAEFTKA